MYTTAECSVMKRGFLIRIDRLTRLLAFAVNVRMIFWMLLLTLGSSLSLAEEVGRDARPVTRIALVIGNSDYPTAPLKNPVNDARGMAKLLESVGFTVLLKENLSLISFIESLREFGGMLESEKDAVGFFYYAGHAMQVNGSNYLVPVDANIQAEDEVSVMTVDTQNLVLSKMARARTRVNIIVLDACRDNPFIRGVRSNFKGLAEMQGPRGTYIAYATDPGSTASDGSGENGIYTKHLLNNLGTPDVPIEIAFKRVREGVIKETKGKQTPWESTSLEGDFIMKSTKGSSVIASSGGDGEVSKSKEKGSDDASVSKAVDVEIAFWRSVRDSTNPEEVALYTKRYPNGQFADLAKIRIEKLKLSSQSIAPIEPSTVSKRNLPPSPKSGGVLHKGDSWTYSLSTKAQKDFATVTIELLETSVDEVKEKITYSGSRSFTEERQVRLGWQTDKFLETVVFPGNFQLAEFAPYIPSGIDLVIGQSWGGVVSSYHASLGGKRQLPATLQVVARERIRVPAGSFDAFKIEVATEVPTVGTTLAFKSVYWYAPQVARTIKVQVATIVFGLVGYEDTFELRSFKQTN